MFTRLAATACRPVATQQFRLFATKAPTTPTAAAAVVAKLPKAPKVEVESLMVEKLPKVPKELKVAKEPKVAKELKEPKASKEPKEPKIAKEPKAPKAPKVAVSKAQARKEAATAEAISREPVDEAAAGYAERSHKLIKQLASNRALMEKQMAKRTPDVELIEKYKIRIEGLEVKLDRSQRLFKRAQIKGLRLLSIKNAPTPEFLAGLSFNARLNAIMQSDLGLKTGYQLFARELKLTKGGSFADYMVGWKALGPETQRAYVNCVQTARDAAAAAV